MEKERRTNDKKRKNPPNCYKRGNGWYVNFTVRGQRYTEALGPVSRGVARETAARRKTAAAEGRLEVGHKIEDLAFETACQKYLNWYCVHSRPKSYERHVASAVALKAYFGERRLSQISSFLVEEYKSDRRTDCVCPSPPERDGSAGRCQECKHLLRARSESTINRELAMLKHLFTKAIEWDFATTNPVRQVKMFRESAGRTRYLSQGEAQALIAACNEHFRPSSCVRFIRASENPRYPRFDGPVWTW